MSFNRHTFGKRVAEQLLLAAATMDEWMWAEQPADPISWIVDHTPMVGGNDGFRIARNALHDVAQANDLTVDASNVRELLELTAVYVRMIDVAPLRAPRRQYRPEES